MKDEDEVKYIIEEGTLEFATITPTNIPLMISDVRDGKNEELLRICEDGSIMWLKDGLLVKAMTDKDVGLAFACAIEGMTSISNPRVIIAKLQMDALQPIADLTKDFSNDSELGAAVRQLFRNL